MLLERWYQDGGGIRVLLVELRRLSLSSSAMAKIAMSQNCFLNDFSLSKSKQHMTSH